MVEKPKDEGKKEPQNSKPPFKVSEAWKSRWLGIYLIVISIILAFCVLGLWYPSTIGGGENAPSVWKTSAPIFGCGMVVDAELRLILLVILAGALGSYVHAATSFATFRGNKTLVESWYWWYVLRPFIGMALALIIYFTIRGGFLLITIESEGQNVNPFAVGAISGLVGMFSKQAADKLNDIFKNLLTTKTGGDEERANKLGDMIPVCGLMLDAKMIKTYTMGADEKEESINIKKIYDLFEGIVTRVPILTSIGAVKYIIHQSLLYKFISKMVYEPTGEGRKIEDLTLKDFLEFKGMRDMVEKSLAFVALDAKLGEAKRAMEATPKCQDVFVTQTGKSDEKMLGWLTNVDIAKHLKA